MPLDHFTAHAYDSSAAGQEQILVTAGKGWSAAFEPQRQGTLCKMIESCVGAIVQLNGHRFVFDTLFSCLNSTCTNPRRLAPTGRIYVHKHLRLYEGKRWGRSKDSRKNVSVPGHVEVELVEVAEPSSRCGV